MVVKYVSGNITDMLHTINSNISGLREDHAELTRLANNATNVLSGAAGTQLQQSLQVLLRDHDNFIEALGRWHSAGTSALQSITDADAQVSRSLTVS